MFLLLGTYFYMPTYIIYVTGSKNMDELESIIKLGEVLEFIKHQSISSDI